MAIKLVLQNVIQPAIRNIFNRLTRFAYNFDGIDDYAVLPFRAINPDGDIDIEFWTASSSKAVSVIVSQNISATQASREFQLWTASNGTSLRMIIGGAAFTSLATVIPNTKYRLTLIGNTTTVYSASGVVVASQTTIRGSAREPSALTAIGVNTEGVIGTYGNHFSGIQRDIKINGILYPMADRAQTIQLPQPRGLGAELITQSVLENPFSKGSQWSYLGNGRWQYIGDGSFNELAFIPSASQPQSGYLEFEVESISGQIRCYTSTASIGALQSNPIFSSTGVFRYYYNSKTGLGGLTHYFAFVRQSSGVPASCIIKNISFKPLSVTDNINLWGGRNLSSANSATVTTNTSGSNWTVTRTGSNIPADAGRASDFTTLEVGALYSVSFDSSSPVHLALYDGGFVLKDQVLSNTMVFRAQAVNKIYVCPATQNLAVTVSNPRIVKLDSLCNPMTLVNTTSDRWQEVPQ